MDTVKEELTLTLDGILEGFTLEEVEEILKTQILESLDCIMETETKTETVKLDDLFCWTLNIGLWTKSLKKCYFYM